MLHAGYRPRTSVRRCERITRATRATFGEGLACYPVLALDMSDPAQEEISAFVRARDIVCMRYSCF